MLKSFLQDTVDMILDALAALGLLRGGSAWQRARLRRKLEQTSRRAENFGRAVAVQHRMCRNCGALVPAKDSVCPRCGASMRGIPRGGAGRLVRGVLPSFGSVSATLLGVMATVYLASAVASPAPGSLLAPSGEILGRLGAMNLYWLVGKGQWWRVVNPIFLHGGLLHVGFNAYVLSVIGPVIEAEIGRRKFLVLFIGTGIASFLSSALASFFEPRWSVGASGALFGLIGFGIVAGFRQPLGLLRRAAPQLVMWAVINFLIGFGLGFVDNAAHFGGLVAGALVGLWISGPGVRGALEDRLWTLAAWAAGLLPVAGLISALLAGG